MIMYCFDINTIIVYYFRKNFLIYFIAFKL